MQVLDEHLWKTIVAHYDYFHMINGDYSVKFVCKEFNKWATENENELRLQQLQQVFPLLTGSIDLRNTPSKLLKYSLLQKNSRSAKYLNIQTKLPVSAYPFIMEACTNVQRIFTMGAYIDDARFLAIIRHIPPQCASLDFTYESISKEAVLQAAKLLKEKVDSGGTCSLTMILLYDCRGCEVNAVQLNADFHIDFPQCTIEYGSDLY